MAICSEYKGAENGDRPDCKSVNAGWIPDAYSNH